MRLLSWLLLVLVVIIILSLGKCVMDVRSWDAETRLTVTNSMEPTEQNYRDCLRREAGMVGVVSLKQMQKCSKETGYVD